MEPARSLPANEAEPTRTVGTVKVYLPNKQRTVVSPMGQKCQWAEVEPLVSLQWKGWLGLGRGFCRVMGESGWEPLGAWPSHLYTYAQTGNCPGWHECLQLFRQGPQGEGSQSRLLCGIPAHQGVSVAFWPTSLGTQILILSTMSWDSLALPGNLYLSSLRSVNVSVHPNLFHSLMACQTCASFWLSSFLSTHKLSFSPGDSASFFHFLINFLSLSFLISVSFFWVGPC